MAELRRQLGLFDATMVVVGSVIGVGIFTTTGFAAAHLPDPTMILMLWAFGGLVSLAGALSLAELGSAMPEAGGDYVYLKELYGPIWGFLTGWTSFCITFSGSIAALAVGLADYLSYFFPALGLKYSIFWFKSPVGNFSLASGHIVAVASILLLTAINYCGVKLGTRTQDALSVLKIATIAAFAVLGFVLGRGDWANFSVGEPLGDPDVGSFLNAAGLALIPILFAYNGWNASVYIAGEIKEPERNMVRSLFWGTLLSTLIYLLLNVAFIYAVPVTSMKNVLRVAELAGTQLFGGWAASYLTAAIIISILGCMNAMILTGARIYYAMAKDGVFFRQAEFIHPRYYTPSVALVYQGIWSSLLVLSGTFEQLLTYVMFAIILFSSITVAGVYVLRMKRSELIRPYQTWGYPFVPALYILASLWLMVNTLVQRPQESIAGLAIIGLGVPVYLYWRRTIKKRPQVGI